MHRFVFFNLICLLGTLFHPTFANTAEDDITIDIIQTLSFGTLIPGPGHTGSVTLHPDQPVTFQGGLRALGKQPHIMIAQLSGKPFCRFDARLQMLNNPPAPADLSALTLSEESAFDRFGQAELRAGGTLRLHGPISTGNLSAVIMLEVIYQADHLQPKGCVLSP